MVPLAPSAPHTSVLLEETLALLAPRSGGLYCDGTCGAGGHSRALLDRSAPAGRIIGVDRDAHALELTQERLADGGDRVTLLQGRFGELDQVLGDAKLLPLDGLLVDLGVSSMQLDDPARGFSFRGAGPVDMRMDRDVGETAAELIHRLDADTLADLIRQYGEERHAGRIARALKSADEAGTIDDTRALAKVIEEAIPAKERHREQARGGIHPATRTFQALRIAVNDELGEIERLLGFVVELLATGGRLAVIAFHSLEDRIVKDRLRELSTPVKHPVTGAPIGEPPLRLLTRKPIMPTALECEQNPRARSARLRGAERTAAPWPTKPSTGVS